METHSPQPLSATPRIQFVRKRSARRYIMRVTEEGLVRVTVPAFGSKMEAQAFVDRNREWLAKQLQKAQRKAWGDGTEFYYRGEVVRLGITSDLFGSKVNFGDQEFSLPVSNADWKGVIEHRLMDLAMQELPARTLELAAQHQLLVRRITVRDQKSRWGSCSVRRTISLNWRLIQTPDFVRDYILVHELMHLREMNHSARFWSHVAEAFPRYLEAEKWLRKNGRALRS